MTTPGVGSVAPGTIITFYSYKGGTGRSMSVANIGVLLAQRQARLETGGVLLVDWDLEAPGLHRFFRDRLPGEAAAKPGLIEIFWRLRELVQEFPAGQQEPDAASEARLRSGLDLSRFVIKTEIPSLHLLKAGAFDEAYPERVNTFGWEALYVHAPWVIPWFAGWLAEHFAYVVVDSRTGVTDTSGICTTLLPEKLVVVFTPNLQSIEGAIEQVEKATSYRRRSDDLRPLLVYPLPSRIESQLPKLRDRWRFDSGFGYQPLFEEAFARIYRLDRCDLTAYFDAVQVPQLPDYAFGEMVAVLVERGGDKYSLSRSYGDFLERLLSTASPWDPLVVSHDRSAVGEAVLRAEEAIARLPPFDAEVAWRILGRMVRVERTRFGRIEVSYNNQGVKRTDLDQTALAIADVLVAAGVLRVSARDSGALFELTEPALVGRWPELTERVQNDQEFLLWRQHLGDSLADWEASGRSTTRVLTKMFLNRSEQLAQRRGAELSPLEFLFILESRRAADAEKITTRRRRIRTVLLFAAMVLPLVYYLIRQWPDKSHSVRSEYFTSVCFSDRSNGFLVGWATDDPARLLFTTGDGGRSWRRQRLQAPGIPIQVSFVDRDHGWILTDQYFSRTTNGGRLWLSHDLLTAFGVPRTVTDVQGKNRFTRLSAAHFLTPALGWLGGSKGLLLKTDQGGGDWIRKDIPGFRFDIADIHFVDPSAGWLVGEFGFTAATADGGSTWELGRVNAAEDLNAVFFVDRQTGWAGGKAGIFATSNGGKTWTLASAESTHVRSLFFLDGRTGWAAGISGIFATTDGRNWIRQFGGPWRSVSSIWFADKSMGWAAGDEGIESTAGRLFSTVDGGRTWQDATPLLPRGRPAQLR